MGWFRRRPPAGNNPADGASPRESRFRRYSPETAAQIQRDQEALERGDLPEGALTRIRRTTAGELPWMSTLSVPGLALAEQLRAEPVVQVAGSAYYHAATDQGNRVYLDSNLDAANLVRAYYQAKDLAMGRLVQEAALAGAHLVLDARHEFSREETVVTFSIIGTAVRLPGVDRPKTPLVSPLGGDDLLKLLARGYLPVGFALGYHWHCMPIGFGTRQSLRSFWNQEATQLTERFMHTRSNAMQRMAQDARRQHRVDGLVGVSVSSRLEETELRFVGGYGMGGGVTIEGMYYPYGPEGSLEVPAVNAEFFATGASIARVAAGPASRYQVSHYLTAEV
ncbi:MAG: hypothetical protein M0Z53_09240 [Thermaerobacter sp.]|nr:hypothetical protein [Thermaerobacter sp.]